MPRLRVPRSTRTMYGTVRPVVVVVVARSGGVLPTVYGLKQLFVGGGARGLRPGRAVGRTARFRPPAHFSPAPRLRWAVSAVGVIPLPLGARGSPSPATGSPCAA